MIENQLIGFKRLSDKKIFDKNLATYEFVTSKNGVKSYSFVIEGEIVTKYKWRYLIRCECGTEVKIRKDHFNNYKKLNKKYLCLSCQQKGELNRFWSSKNPIPWQRREHNKDILIETGRKISETRKNFSEEKKREIYLKTITEEYRKTRSITTKKVVKKMKETDMNRYILWRRKLKGRVIKSRAHIKVEKQLDDLNIDYVSEHILEGPRNYRYDIYIESLNLLIEINGDKIHANPKFYKADDVIHNAWNSFIAKDKWEYDLNKKIYAEERGFSVLTLWSSDIHKIDFKIIL